MAGDPNFDTGAKSGGLASINSNYAPSIPKDGSSEGGPSKRRPFARKNPQSPSMLHKMTSPSVFGHQMHVPSLPSDMPNAPRKPGTDNTFFPPGGKMAGLNSIG